MRIEKSHPKLPAVKRGVAVTITIDGREIKAYEGETVAAVVITARLLGYRYSQGEKPLPGFFCGMGICYGCLLLVDGKLRRACLTLVEEGMQVTSGEQRTAGGE